MATLSTTSTDDVKLVAIHDTTATHHWVACLRLDDARVALYLTYDDLERIVNAGAEILAALDDRKPVVR